MGGEQFGEDPGHRPPVLHHVADPRRHPHVVLEDAEAALLVADQVDAANVRANPVRRVDAVRGAVEVRAGEHQPAGDDPVGQDLRPPVDVGEERLQRPDTLGDAAFDDVPFGVVQQAGDEVQREGPLLAEEVEGDPGVPERPVERGLAGGEVAAAQRPESVVERGVQRPRGVRSLEHLVPGLCGLGRIPFEEVRHIRRA